VSTHEHRDPRAPGGGRVGLLEGQLSRTYRLRPSLELLPVDDVVYVLRPGEGDLALRGLGEAETTVLSTLSAQPVGLPSLLAALRRRSERMEPAALIELLSKLEAAGVVLAGAADPEPPSPRHARQEPYLAALGLSQRDLRGATVAVLGCGGLGTWALASLAGLGVGRLVLADDDIVEPSNLNRQVLYGARDVGARKVDCAARWVQGFDPDLEVVAHPLRVRGPADVALLVDGADALVLAADWPPYELARWVNAACQVARVPFLTAGQVPPLLRVGPCYMPGRTACFACHETHLRAGAPLYDELVRRRLAAAHEPAVTLAPSSGLIGTLVAMELLHLLARREPPATAGRALLIDMRTLDMRWEAVPADPSCPACEHPADERDRTTDHDPRPGGRTPDAPPDPPGAQRAGGEPA
jgi:molybdopterin-synthase adenylyltransferase